MTQPIPRPAEGEYAPFYAGYVAAAGEALDLAALERQPRRLRAMLHPLSDEAALARYAPGKWSVKEVVGHMADAERIFAYRALRFGRGDATPLSSFDENLFVEAADFDRHPLADLLADFEAARAATLSQLRLTRPDAWALQGVASGHPVSVRALVYILTGHVEHHMRVLRERYGLAPEPEAPLA